MLLLVASSIAFSGPGHFASTSSARAPAVTLYGAMAKKWESSHEGESFVGTEMRGAAMALHTKGQAPKEGKAKETKAEQAPVQTWQPGKADYLQFLVDSKHVYAALEEICASEPKLASFCDSGLERAEPLARDIAWFADEGVAAPEVAPQGSTYATMLREMVDKGEVEAFVCHFCARARLFVILRTPPAAPSSRADPITLVFFLRAFTDNFYFAHTAGGRMIGKRMADMLLEGKTLNFYQWDKGDVDKELLPGLRGKIDAMADGWTREQKDLCLAQTADSFKFGGALLQHISRPNAAKEAAKAA